MTITSVNNQYPKLAAFNAIYELADNSVTYTVKSFAQSVGGDCVITLSDDSLMIAKKVDVASRAYVDAKTSPSKIYLSPIHGETPLSTSNRLNAEIKRAYDIGADIEFSSDDFYLGGSSSPDSLKNGLLFPSLGFALYNKKKHITVMFAGSRFIAMSNDMVIIRFSCSYTKFIGSYSTDRNGHTNVIDNGLLPEDTETKIKATPVNGMNPHNQIWNKICSSENISAETAWAFQCGVNATNGLQASCYYNTIEDAVNHDPLIGWHFREPNDTNGSLCNRNKIIGGGTFSHASTRCRAGVLIDAGDSNRFIAHDFEGIRSATPLDGFDKAYAVIIRSRNGGNWMNKFIGCTAEACSGDIYSELKGLDLIGSTFHTSKCSFPNGEPLTSIGGGVDASILNQHAVGWFQRYSDKSLNNLNDVRAEDTLNSNASVQLVDTENIHSIKEAVYSTQRLGAWVDYALRIQFTVTDANLTVKIALPFVPNLDQYRQYRFIQPMATMSTYATDSSGAGSGACYTKMSSHTQSLNNKPYLEFHAPDGGWNPNLENPWNCITLMMRVKV